MKQIVFLLVCTMMNWEIDAMKTNSLKAQLHISKYSNSMDKLASGSKCELFHGRDKCDPRFEISFTSGTKSIFSETTGIFSNKIFIDSVLKTSFTFTDNFPLALQFSINVVDVDTFGGNGQIARFTGKFDVDMKGPQQTTLTSSYSSLTIRIEIQCNDYWSGELCDFYCQPKLNNYECDIVSRERLCTLKCVHGICSWIEDDEMFKCHCFDGFDGDMCENNILDKKTTATSTILTTLPTTLPPTFPSTTLSTTTSPPTTIETETSSTTEITTMSPEVTPIIVADSTSDIIQFSNFSSSTMIKNHEKSESTSTKVKSVGKNKRTSIIVIAAICIFLILVIAMIVIVVQLVKRKKSAPPPNTKNFNNNRVVYHIEPEQERCSLINPYVMDNQVYGEIDRTAAEVTPGPGLTRSVSTFSSHQKPTTCEYEIA